VLPEEGSLSIPTRHGKMRAVVIRPPRTNAANDIVLEIGPGLGILTERLLGKGAHVVAVEMDRRLARAAISQPACITTWQQYESVSLAVDPDVLTRMAA